jgi:hypothetical protein
MFIENSPIKEITQAGHWWLTPIILATWKAEIRRRTVQGEPGGMACSTRTPISKIPNIKKGWQSR